MNIASKYKDKIIITIIILGGIIALCFFPDFNIDYNLKSFYPKNDTDKEFYDSFCMQFNCGDEIIAIAIRKEEGVFNKKFLNDVDSFTNECNKIEHIKNSVSLTTLTYPIKTPFIWLDIPFLHHKDSLRYQVDSAKIIRNKYLKGWMISNDGKSLNVVLQAEKNLDNDSKAEVINQITLLLGNYSFKEYHLLGEIYTDVMYCKRIETERMLVLLLVSVVALVVSVVLFRSWKIVFLLFFSIVLADIYLYGYFGIFNRSANILSTLFPSIIMVVAMSDFVHIYSKYINGLKQGLNKKQAIKDTVKDVGLATLLTSITTSVGFLALMVSPLSPIRGYGLNVAVGVMLTFVIIIGFVPSMLMFIKINPSQKHAFFYSGLWPGLLSNMYYFGIKNKKSILYISLIVIVLSIFGILRIDTNSHLLSHISNRSSFKKDFVFFEENFSGSRQFAIAIVCKNDHKINEYVVLSEIDKINKYLEDSKAFTQVFSPVLIYEFLDQAYTAKVDFDYKLPKGQKRIDLLEQYIEKSAGNLSDQYINSDKTWGKITANIKDIGMDEMSNFYGETDAWINSNIDTTLFDVKFTGSSYMFDKGNNLLIRNMLFSLLLALIIVGIIVTIMFRSIVMSLISLIPNVFPLLIIGAIIGFFGIQFNGTLAMVFTISFVIAVDDTIHFLSKLKLERAKGIDLESALSNTINETGKPIIVTSIALFLAFIVLMYASELNGIFYHSILISITSIVAVLADLFLLPVILRTFLSSKRK